jgi:protein-disulfide isomerase
LAEQRQQQARADRRRRQTNIGLMVVVALVAVGIVAYAALQSNSSSGPSSAALPAAVHEQSGGAVFGDGPVNVDMWIDFQCPICKQYEATYGQMLQQKVQSGDVTLTVHPLSFLDDNLHNGSSTLAANAFACATDEGSAKAMDFALAVYKAQPPEQDGQDAWTTDDLISIGNDVGIQGSQWESCVQDGTYNDWVKQVEASQQDKGVTGTPTVFVDGKQLQPADDLQAAIESASGSN